MSDPREIARCAREAEEVKEHNVSKGHRDRRARIENQLQQHLMNHGTVLGLIRMWETTMAPSSAKGHVSTLLKQHPELKTREILDAQDRIRQSATVMNSKRAIPITPGMFKRLMKEAPPRVAHTALMMLISACRHMDLLRVIHFRAFQKGIVLLQWSNFKSDRYGERAVAKFIELPERYRHLSQMFDLATYKEVYKELKKVDKNLTVHSLRRAAAFYLAQAGFSMAEIQALTAHTPTEDACKAVRRYVDPSPTQPESLLQIKMSRVLAKMFGLAWASNRH